VEISIVATQEFPWVSVSESFENWPIFTEIMTKIKGMFFEIYCRLYCAIRNRL